MILRPQDYRDRDRVAPCLTFNSTPNLRTSSRHLTRGCFKIPGNQQDHTRRSKIPGKHRICPKTVPRTFCPVLAACPSLPARPVLAKCPPQAVDGIAVDGSKSRDFKRTTIRFSDAPLTSLSIFSALRGLLPELFELCESGVPFFAPFDREQRNLQLGARPEHGRRDPIASQRFCHVIAKDQSAHSVWGSQRTRPMVARRACGGRRGGVRPARKSRPNRAAAESCTGGAAGRDGRVGEREREEGAAGGRERRARPRQARGDSF